MSNIEVISQTQIIKVDPTTLTTIVVPFPSSSVSVINAGPVGPPGSTGLTGDIGLQGEQGDPGPQGIQGIKGDVGDDGPQGIQGVQGIQGLKGDTGNQGVKGDTGDQGLKGDIGDTGDPGPQGIQGVKGDTGNQGVKGDTGNIGAQGIQGIQGIPGLKGDTGDIGEQGPQGTAGVDGLTSYEVWINNGNVGSIDDFLISLKGETGNQGDPGDPGEIGPEGPSGIDGLSSYDLWLADNPGGDWNAYQYAFTGPQGIQGEPGLPGADGSPDTGFEILAKLILIDGTGSELDADLLDGLHGSDYIDYSDSSVSAHAADTTAIHGIADTSLLATKAYADSAASNATAALVDSSPTTLDTLHELANALGSDPNFATTMTTALGGKQASSGNLTAIAALTQTSYGRGFLELVNSNGGRTYLGLGSVASLTSDTDVTLTANSDSNISTQKAVKAYADTGLVLKVAKAGDGMTGALSVTQGTSSAVALFTQVTSDTQNRFQIAQDGGMQWGSGSATPDIYAYRDAVGQIGWKPDMSAITAKGSSARYYSYGTNGKMSFRRSAGTPAVPTALGTTSVIGALSFQGLDDTSNYVESAKIEGVSGEAYTSTTFGSYLTFYTTSLTTSTAVERLRISAGGTVQIASITAQASLGTVEKLRVNTPTTVDNLATVIITPSSSSNKGLVCQGLSGQLTSVWSAQDSTGTTTAFVTPSGDMGAVTFSNSGGNGPQFMFGGTYTRLINRNTASNVVFAVRGMVSQSGDLQQWQDSTPTTLARVTAAGVLQVNSTGTAGTVEKFRVNTPTTTDSVANAILSTDATTSRALSLQGIASQAAQMFTVQGSGGVVAAAISVSGVFSGSSFGNVTSSNNALVTTASTGVIIARNIADVNTALTVNQTHASSTGDIQDWMSAGSIKLSVLYGGHLSFSDGVNIIPNTTTGTKIGTAVGQKLAFWNATPIVQPLSASQALVATTAATNTTPYGFTTAAQANGIITLLNEIRNVLVNTGLMKGSA